MVLFYSWCLHMGFTDVSSSQLWFTKHLNVLRSILHVPVFKYNHRDKVKTTEWMTKIKERSRIVPSFTSPVLIVRTAEEIVAMQCVYNSSETLLVCSSCVKMAVKYNMSYKCFHFILAFAYFNYLVCEAKLSLKARIMSSNTPRKKTCFY